jgi:hypothetical protein
VKTRVYKFENIYSRPYNDLYKKEPMDIEMSKFIGDKE